VVPGITEGRARVNATVTKGVAAGSSFTPASGIGGSQVVVTVANSALITEAYIGGVASVFVVTSGTTIEVTVPFSLNGGNTIELVASGFRSPVPGVFQYISNRRSGTRLRRRFN
jgi:hypothetical protein